MESERANSSDLILFQTLLFYINYIIRHIYVEINERKYKKGTIFKAVEIEERGISRNKEQ